MATQRAVARATVFGTTNRDVIDQYHMSSMGLHLLHLLQYKYKDTKLPFKITTFVIELLPQYFSYFRYSKSYLC